MWRITLALLLALLLAIFGGIYFHRRPAGQTTQVPTVQIPQVSPETALELVITGPKSVRRGQGMRFDSALINHSAAPIVINAPNPALVRLHGYFELTWSATEASRGMVMPRQIGICPVGGPGFAHPGNWVVHDDQVTVLQPGQRYELDYRDDPSDYLQLSRRGHYLLTKSYRFEPPHFSDEVSVNGAKLPNTVDGSALSSAKRALLKSALPSQLTSKPWAIDVQ